MQHDANVDQENLLAAVDDAIENTLSRIMETTESRLNSFADGNDLAVRGVVSFPVSSNEKCTAAAPNVCTDLAVTVSVSHRTSVSQADIRNAMLEEDVVATLAANIPVSSAYTGDLSVQADMILNLDGVPSAEMSADETALLERVTLDFLRKRLDGGYTITDARVFGQNLVSTKEATTLSPAGDNLVLSGRHRKHTSTDEGGRTLRALRALQSSSAGSLEVSVRITGESRNPRKRDLERKVEDTIDSEGERFSNDLREAAEMDPVVSRSSYFDDILPVTSKPVDGPDSSPGPAPQVDSNNNSSGNDSGPPIGIIIGAIVGGVLSIAVAAFLYIKFFGGKSKQQKEFHQQVISYGSSQRFDDGFGDDAYKSMHSTKNKNSYKDEKMARRSSFGGSGGGGPLPSDIYGKSSYDLASKGQIPAKVPMDGGAAVPGAVSQKNKASYDLESKMQFNGGSAGAVPGNSRIQNKMAYNGGGAPQGAAPRRASGTTPRRFSGTAPRRSSGTRGGPRRGSGSSGALRSSVTSNTSGSRNRPPNERRRSSSGELSAGFLGEEDLHFR